MTDKNWNSGNMNSGYRNSGNRNSGYRNSGNRNSGDWNSGHRNSGDWNSGNMNSGDMNSGDCNSGDWNSGYRNSGDCNSGNRNSGIFNTNEPRARFFNKETDMTLTEFYNSSMCPSWGDFPLNRWVNKDDMNKKEKEEINGWEEMGGYLKTLGYKEAWKVFWAETSEDNRKKFLNLPNFSWNIFTSITGIRPTTANKNPKVIDIDGARYKLIEEK